MAVDNLLHSGIALYQDGDYPRAAKLLRRVINRAQDPRRADQLAEAHCFLAESLFSLDEEEEAAYHFQLAENILFTEVDRPESRSYYYRVLLGLATTAISDSIQKSYYQKLFDLVDNGQLVSDAAKSAAYYSKGILSFQAGRIDEATRWIQQSADIQKKIGGPEAAAEFNTLAYFSSLNYDFAGAIANQKIALEFLSKSGMNEYMMNLLNLAGYQIDHREFPAAAATLTKSLQFLQQRCPPDFEQWGYYFNISHEYFNTQLQLDSVQSVLEKA